MRRCRKQTDSFTFLKRSPSLVKKVLPTASQCRTVQKKLVGVKMEKNTEQLTVYKHGVVNVVNRAIGRHSPNLLELIKELKEDSINAGFIKQCSDTVKEPSICSISVGAPCCNDPECTCPEKILLQQLRSRSSPLFCTIAQQGIPDLQKSPFTPDMLITGFGLRNLSSMQQALLSQMEKESVEEEYFGSITSDLDKSMSSQTEITLSSTASADELEQKKKKLEYFMGITTTMDEGEEEKSEEEVSKYVQFEEVPSEEVLTGDTESMRRAQKYLRVHRIFQFFQFLIAHLLSAIPDNPIEFLIELLEKCLIYRSGIGEPPLLYRRPHIGQLFYLMDRMETGYVSLTQYSTGMKTLGICNFMENPPSTKDGMVARDFFIDEAYSKLTEQFNDMVKKHYLRGHRPSLSQPPPTPQPTSKTWSVPLDFLTRAAEEEGDDVDDEKNLIEICKARRKESK